MKAKFYLGVLFLSAVSGKAFSATNVWVNNATINGVQVMHDGTFIAYLPANEGSICSQGGRLHYVQSGVNEVTPEGLKSLLSIALVAQTTGKKVSILYDPGSSNCYVQRIYLSNEI